MEAVLAAGQIPQMNSIKVVALASEQEMDRSIEYAFTQAVHHLKPYWEEAFAEGRLVFRKSSQLAAILSRAGSRNTLNRLRKVADSGDLSLKERRGAAICSPWAGLENSGIMALTRQPSLKAVNMMPRPMPSFFPAS